MLRIVTIEEVRDVCRVTGPENDSLLLPIASSAEAYVASKVGRRAALSGDPRVKRAVLIKCRLDFRPDEDLQGNISRSFLQLLLQVAADRPLNETEVTDGQS